MDTGPEGEKAPPRTLGSTNTLRKKNQEEVRKEEAKEVEETPGESSCHRTRKESFSRSEGITAEPKTYQCEGHGDLGSL